MPADPKHAGRKRSLRQRIRSLGQLGLKTEVKEEEQQAPFEIVHTPDRPGRLISPLEAPTEEDCAIDIKTWQWASEQQEKINSPIPPKHLGMFRYGAQIPLEGQGERGPDTGYLSPSHSSTQPYGPTPHDGNDGEYDESYVVDKKQLVLMEGVRRGLCPHCRRIFANPAAENCPHCAGDLTPFRVYRPSQVPQSIHIQLQQQDEGSGRSMTKAGPGPGSVASTAHSTELGWWGKLPDNPEVTPSPSELTLVLPSSVGSVSEGPPSTVSKLSSIPDLFGRDDEAVPRPLASERFKKSMSHNNGSAPFRTFATMASIPTKTSNGSLASNSNSTGSSGSNGTIRLARADEMFPREPERGPSPLPAGIDAGAGKARFVNYNKPLPPITQHQRWQTTDQRVAHERMIRENGDDADLFMNIYDNYSEPRSS
ncbi:hypothetical protein B0T19DRAFT_400102 [Cercophora scortea]|uniref:Uncharacterized protein n=1 Tax=Cercophora scortea TaxID=314031 RepID=A0AAE0ILA1_9PEZI|nr:hypothetical protein B0T19DRAFT_400102 [Cercophora scortea]